MYPKRPVVAYGSTLCELKEGDRITANSIVLSKDPNNDVSVKSGLLSLPQNLILGSGCFENRWLERVIKQSVKTFSVDFPTYKSFTAEKLNSIIKQYNIFVRFNSYFACNISDKMPEYINHRLVGKSVDQSSLLNLDPRLKITPIAYQTNLAQLDNEKNLTIIKNLDNQKTEYKVYSINRAVYEIYESYFRPNDSHFRCTVSAETWIPKNVMHFYDYELFAVRKN